jgi:uncharacterized protein
MIHPVIKRRRAERKEKIDLARAYVRAIAPRIGVEHAWVVGSVARGDFNVWSDIDVVLIAPDLPETPLSRADLFLDKPPGVQIVAYTQEEFGVGLARKNPLVLEATRIGVPIGGPENPSHTRPGD